MAKDILSEYGPESTSVSRSHCGGVEEFKSLPYSEPKGPIGQSHNSVGLGGSNKGNGQRPLASSGEGGSPGIGGTNHGCCGSQGQY